MTITLSPHTIESWERCRRLGMYQQDWKAIRVTPLGMVYSGLRTVLTESSGEYTGPEMAREHVIRLAGECGVQTNRPDPYAQVVHYAHLAEVLARTLRQPSTGALVQHPQVGDWQPESYLVDGDTRLIRFVLVDRWDDDRQMAELHSWRTVGDICVTGLPMQLRVLVIGSSQNGKRHGHWTKARQHPYTKELRFQRKHDKSSGEGFTESYKTVWREDSKVGPDKWLEQMARDGVLREVAFTRNVNVPTGRQREMVLDDINRVGEEIRAGIRDRRQFPMTRSACDLAGPGRGPCLYQATCFSPIEVTPGETGLFERINLRVL